jgi:type II secretory pathway pseudopilin PulG
MTTSRRAAGLTLIEVAVAASLFAVVALFVAASLTTSMRGSAEQRRRTEALALLRAFRAELQRRANDPSPSLGPGSLFGFCLNGATPGATNGWAVGSPFHNSTGYALGTRLRGPGPLGEATIVCRVYKNETTNTSGDPPSAAYSTYSPVIPGQLGGGPLDLNMDADADDECTPDDLKLVPVRITVNYREARGDLRSIDLYTLVTKTAS